MKKIFSLIVFVSLLVAGCQSKLKVKVVENLKTEYGQKLDNALFFNKKESDDNVKVKNVEGFNPKKIGEQEIIVTFTDGDKTKVEKIKVIVEDTKTPVIKLKKDMISITTGDNLKLTDNIIYVKDPIDGDFKYSDKIISKDGYYIDKGKLDTKKAGTYEVKVIAVDKNGNKAEESFKITVKKKETPNKLISNNSGNKNSANDSSSSISSTDKKPSNLGNSSSSNSGSSSNGSSNNSEDNSGGQKPDNPKPHKHSITVTGHPDVVYSGMFFTDEEKCDTWASNYAGPNNEWSSFNYSSKQCSCGMWSPYFFNIGYWE